MAIKDADRRIESLEKSIHDEVVTEKLHEQLCAKVRAETLLAVNETVDSMKKEIIEEIHTLRSKIEQR